MNKEKFLNEYNALLKAHKQGLVLLRDLADLQNGPPLEKYRKDWEETMQKVYNFLNEHEESNARVCEHPEEKVDEIKRGLYLCECGKWFKKSN